jgi:hypothetical protein
VPEPAPQDNWKSKKLLEPVSRPLPPQSATVASSFLHAKEDQPRLSVPGTKLMPVAPELKRFPASKSEASSTTEVKCVVASSDNPVHWSVEDVVRRISEADPTLVPYAGHFRKHEIDGRALLLLTSEMIMKYMGLKLGPTLKLCNILENLKSRIQRHESGAGFWASHSLFLFFKSVDHGTDDALLFRVWKSKYCYTGFLFKGETAISLIEVMGHRFKRVNGKLNARLCSSLSLLLHSPFLYATNYHCNVTQLNNELFLYANDCIVFVRQGKKKTPLYF